MPYGIRLKKIMRVITRVPVGDYLIIILLGISSSLLEMDKLDCIRQTSPSLPLTNHVTLEKSFQFYAFSVLKFYSSTCCDKDNCEEPLRHRGGWSPQPQQSPCSGSLHLADEMKCLGDSWNHCHYSGRTRQPEEPESSSLIFELELPPLVPSQARSRTDWDQETCPLEFLRAE